MFAAAWGNHFPIQIVTIGTHSDCLERSNFLAKVCLTPSYISMYQLYIGKASLPVECGRESRAGRINVRSHSAAPLYRQVADQIRTLIENGEFAVGERLPGERELAEKLGVSRPTIREALIALEVEGLVHIRMGSGIYVTRQQREKPALAPAEDLEGPFELLRARSLIECAIAEEAAKVDDACSCRGSWTTC